MFKSVRNLNCNHFGADSIAKGNKQGNKKNGDQGSRPEDAAISKTRKCCDLKSRPQNIVAIVYF